MPPVAENTSGMPNLPDSLLKLLPLVPLKYLVPVVDSICSLPLNAASYLSVQVQDFTKRL